MDSGNFFVFYLLFNHISAQNSVIVFIRLFLLLLLFMYVFQGCFNSQPMGNYKDETKCKTLN